MDLLKQSSGFSIIEVLVSITILGLAATLAGSAIIKLTTNPKLSIKNEAFYYVEQEIDNVIAKLIVSDTSYIINRGNLMVKRRIFQNDGLYKAEIEVVFVPLKKSIVKLNAKFKKNSH